MNATILKPIGRNPRIDVLLIKRLAARADKELAKEASKKAALHNLK